MQIIWFPPQPINGILQFYELRYGKYGSAANTSILSVDSETSNATVYGLTPFTTYVFSLRASTGNESFLLWSNWSYPVAVKTQEGGKIQNLLSSTTTKTYIVTSWFLSSFRSSSKRIFNSTQVKSMYSSVDGKSL